MTILLIYAKKKKKKNNIKQNKRPRTWKGISLECKKIEE